MAKRADKKTASSRFVFPFGEKTHGPLLDKKLLGGKGRGLADMAAIGILVPPGFTITTEACNLYRERGKKLPDGLEDEIFSALSFLQKQMGATLGGKQNPLLVSVRSGAVISMPGMMDTVLNVGLNDALVKAFARIAGNEHLAYDSYRRLIAMYADIVHSLDPAPFTQALDKTKKRLGAHESADLPSDALKDLCEEYKKLFAKLAGKPFPQDVHTQLFAAISAVFASWDSKRAASYRQVHRIPNDLGTAVTVQAMVFGNKNSRSATGVGFTRDPSTGEKQFYGEFLTHAQGEEVVAGIRTPHPLNKQQKKLTGSKLKSLEELMPKVYAELVAIVHKLENHYRDMQDIEFTIDDGRLFMLQTRTGKRTGQAAVCIAIDMLQEGLIDERTALMRVDPEQIVQLLSPVFLPKAKRQSADKRVARGLNAGPGAASGCVALTSEKAVAYKKEGKPCILVRKETSPDDFPGMAASKGILTSRGGSTSHAAVVARGMGKPCIVGCGDLHIDVKAKKVQCKKQTVKEGDLISIDGTTGEVFFCGLDTNVSEVVQVLLSKEKKKKESRLYQAYAKLMALADNYRALHVRANADTAHDSAVASAFGAEGIGLCRTEHMFLEQSRLNNVRRMFFSEEKALRKAAIEKLLPHQKKDFRQIFRGLEGRPVTIRLLDPPLHEFLPSEESQLKQLAKELKMPVAALLKRANALKEHNPMLGYRGCRLGILHPEITEMQIRAIMEAAIEVEQEGCPVELEIMVPLVSLQEEFLHQKRVVEETAKQVCQEKAHLISYSIGTMIELPRAALIADKIAEEAQFFSFGTNDLTQTTFGISRDDSARFVPLYIEGVDQPKETAKMQLLARDPFVTIDQEGVGELMRIALVRAKRSHPHLKCGICGEHGADPDSVAYFHDIGIDYVSCSPYRVPVARLAAAQSALAKRKN